ncbi:MAG TPA: tail fiber protein [Bryobacteraceae bacterium]|jgi:microcystin-dependent protein
MSNQFVAEIRAVGFNFAPFGWAQCNGQIIAISQNTALFSLLGTMYGGDGKSNFALPNLETCIPIHQGQLAGGSFYSQGEKAGTQTVTLLTSEMPSHTHAFQTDSTNSADKSNPANAGLVTGPQMYSNAVNAIVPMTQTTPTGSSLPHNNMMPYLCLMFVIALQGVYPARS